MICMPMQMPRAGVPEASLSLISSLTGWSLSIVLSNAPTPGSTMHSASRSLSMSVTAVTDAPQFSRERLMEYRFPTP